VASTSAAGAVRVWHRLGARLAGLAGRLRGPARGPRPVRTPTVLQLEAVECGAAALAMVLGHFGRIVPLATLRRECGVSRDGSKASNMLRAARRYGMEARGYTKRVEDLARLRVPAILFWNFNHFVVFEGFDGSGARLNDPAVGHRTVSMEEFRRALTGIVLVLEPGPDFETGGRRPSIAGAITERLAGSAGAVLFCFLAGLLLVLPGLAVPAFNQVYIDQVILEHRGDWLRPLMLAMLLALGLELALRFLQLRHLRRLHRGRLPDHGRGAHHRHAGGLPEPDAQLPAAGAQPDGSRQHLPGAAR
jgi:ATP-binding cassette, subfamily C, bacterial